MPTDRIAAAKKGALTRERRAAKNAVATTIRKAAGRKAALTRKLKRDKDRSA